MGNWNKKALTQEQMIIMVVLLVLLLLLVVFGIYGPKNILDGIRIPLGGP